MEQVNVSMSNGTPEADQLAHEQKMAAKADADGAQITDKPKDGERTEIVNDTPDPNAVTPRPADIPEKFWDADKGEVNVAALLKSQQDAEAALRAGKNPDEQPAESSAEETPGVTGEQKPIVADASAEYAENGELSADTYTALEGVGLSKDMVDTYIAGQQAIVTSLQAAAGEPFGGLKGFNTAADWAAENLSDDEVAALDVQLTSMNPAIVKQGAAALQAKYAANADITPDVTLTGNGNPGTSGSAFQSSAEMQKAMSDPRYKNDPAFRAEVANKIARSNAELFGS